MSATERVTGSKWRGPGRRSACQTGGSSQRGSLSFCANGLKSLSPVIDGAQALGLVNSSAPTTPTDPHLSGSRFFFVFFWGGGGGVGQEDRKKNISLLQTNLSEAKREKKERKSEAPECEVTGAQ